MKSFPPYRIQVTKEIPITTRAEREQALERAGYNLFNVPANLVTISLLTDSGTGALSSLQEAAAANADRSYAGSDSYHRFRRAVDDLTSYPHIFPVHQGRAAERVLFSSVLKPGMISLSNTHFDTTRANVEVIGCEARDLPCPEAADLDSDVPFKGNIDVAALEQTLAGPDGPRVGQVLVTITNNGFGGQPVSMANLQAVRNICQRYRVPFFLDAARFAENAWLVIQREPGYQRYTPREVAQMAFALADGCVASLKKDAIAAMGAVIGLRDAELAQKCEMNIIGTEGFRTYGGIAGHDLERIAQGLQEVVNPHYLRAREAEAAHLAGLINEAGIDIVRPAGMHGLYVNAGRLLPHIPPHGFPGHALACELYLAGGIQSSELGSLYLGKFDHDQNMIAPAPFELIRLAIPRRTYTEAHLEYVADVLATIAKNPEAVPQYRIVHAPPALRPFKVRLRQVPTAQTANGQ